jgi:hypothetical protein
MKSDANFQLRRFSLIILTLSGSAVHASDRQIAFLSDREQELLPAAPTPDVNVFNGRWIFTSAGCTNTGSIGATIRHGRIIVKGGSGQVSADGTLHSVGAGGGMTLTAQGHLDNETGSGTFDRSDGCSGTWIGIRQH